MTDQPDQPCPSCAHLAARFVHSQAALRRAHEELDWAQEKCRVLERVIVRLGTKLQENP